MAEQDRGLVSHIGPIEIDWPRTIGYYGGIGLATAFELIEPPLALFIAAVPLFKMLNNPRAPRPGRFLAQFLEGAARPVGGSAEATIKLQADEAAQPQALSFMQEARALAQAFQQRRS
jgi:hypothetical protein